VVESAAAPATERETEREQLRLQEDWRAASLRSGWAFPVDWWAPEVEAVVDAAVGKRDLVAPCMLLGRARADAGVGLDEALTDLAALPLPGAGTAAGPLVRALATGWADVACDPATTGVCEDPLTGLTTPAYLRTRLAEAYREAARTGVAVTSSHALVVVRIDLAGASRLSALSRLLLVGAVLRDTFSGGETLARTGPAHAVVLAARDAALAPRVAAAARLLADRLRQADGPPARVWIERLPPALPGAYHLLTELVR
jgi:hypothetical protein